VSARGPQVQAGEEADPAVLAAATALAGLPHMGPARLRALLRAWPAPDAWRRVLAGRPHADRAVAQTLGASRDRVISAWAMAAAATDPTEVLAAHHAAGVEVAVLGMGGYPAALSDDPEPPVVLFRAGCREPLERGPRVAIVGTRRCTAAGASVAAELGRDLSAAGVPVVSGLALGIDGAAHRGALEAPDGAAPPIGVVGSGLDVAYPARHRNLWHAVAARGALLSEAPLGARPEPWRFPARNRIIAALADVVVVVESHDAGGSLHTVDEAADRGIPVLAVPGSVRSPASAGTNQLLHDGCAPARSAADVLDALPGVAMPGSPTGPHARPVPAIEDPALPPSAAQVLDALGGDPAALEQLAVRSGLDLAELSLALDALLAAGLVASDGGWYERVSR
jgi:DNA processing protein